MTPHSRQHGHTVTYNLTVWEKCQRQVSAARLQSRAIQMTPVTMSTRVNQMTSTTAMSSHYSLRLLHLLVCDGAAEPVNNHSAMSHGVSNVTWSNWTCQQSFSNVTWCQKCHMVSAMSHDQAEPVNNLNKYNFSVSKSMYFKSKCLNFLKQKPAHAKCPNFFK